jgi:uncharacterized protein (DUF2141 family)
VFSTGDYIDSLSLGGTVKSAYDKEVESFVSVLLYDVNDIFNDSIIYDENPRYLTNTLDSLKTFRFDNLRAGKYLLVALKDYNSNNKYNPKTDKIGFIKQFITIPNDTLYELELFKETLPFKTFKPSQASGNKLLLAYEGALNSAAALPKLILKNNSEVLSNIITKFPKKDSLQIWYKPIKADSLTLAVTRDKYKTNFTFKTKDQKKDTLSISALQSGPLNFRERFTLESSTPLIRIENSKINLTNNAKTKVIFTTEYDEFNQKLYFDFKKEPSENYTFEILPGALTDFFEKSNDTLTYKLNTKSYSETANLRVLLRNVKQFPIIMELTNSKGDILASEYTENGTTVDFNLLEPSVFSLRVIYDTNKNKEWDSGNYLEKRQAEEVIYSSKEINLHANFDWEEIFDLSIPYSPEPKKKTDKKN